MILTVREIQPCDMRHLFRSDKRLKKEVVRLKRPFYRPRRVSLPEARR